MSTGVQTAVGRFVWHDHNSGDPRKAQEFYRALLGWEIEVWKPGEMDYAMIKANGQMHGGFRVVHTLTRSPPAGWTGYSRRVDAEMLDEVAFAPSSFPHVYVCGPTPFVEAVADGLVSLGHEPTRIRTERFGPTGG